MQVDDPSERVAPTIYYNITTNHSADIYVFNSSESFATYQTTLAENQNLSDRHQRLSKIWRPTYYFGFRRHLDTYISDGLKPGYYYFTVENTAFQTTLEQENVVKPMAMKLDLYVANKDCPF